MLPFILQHSLLTCILIIIWTNNFKFDLSLHKMCYFWFSVQFSCNLPRLNLFSPFPFLINGFLRAKLPLRPFLTRVQVSSGCISQVPCQVFAGFPPLPAIQLSTHLTQGCGWAGTYPSCQRATDHPSIVGLTERNTNMSLDWEESLPGENPYQHGENM